MPLDILLDSCEKDAQLDLFGRFMFKNLIIRLLINRLCVQDELKRHPEAMKEQIRRPLFIVGLPRTGTTLLHNLLSQDPSFRCLYHWEAAAPSLHPKLEGKKPDPRIESAKKTLKLVERFMPDIFTAHPVNAEGPEECQYLLGLTFANEGTFWNLFHTPSYIDWVQKNDPTPVYQYYRKTLQLLQWHQAGDHWLLKSPDHLSRLDALLTVFPDACIIQTHRDPLKVIPSACSLTAIGRASLSRHIDLALIGKFIVNWAEKALEHAAMVRKTFDPARFYDVHYKDLVENPVGTIRDIYKYFGYNHDDRMDTRIQKWLIENRQHKKGVHRYSLEQFNLDPVAINKKFADYTEAFNITKE